MAESTPEQRKRTSRVVTSITLIVLGVAAASALAATVTQAPIISGQPAPDFQLTASRGNWTPAGATPNYEWLRCNSNGGACVGISGACGRHYTVRDADLGHALRVRLTATEANGSAASADSAPTASVTRKPYPIPGEPEDDTCIKVTPTGPGQGTFGSGTETGADAGPAPNTALAFIDPFPVVRIAGRFKGKRTTLTRVSVKAPKGTRIRFDCKGRGCPYKRKALAVKLITVRSLQRTYRPKSMIEVRITEPNKIGKYTRVTTRKGKVPVRIDRCLMPGKSKPVKCPTA